MNRWIVRTLMTCDDDGMLCTGMEGLVIERQALLTRSLEKTVCA